jgi:hypothetical protein
MLASRLVSHPLPTGHLASYPVCIWQDRLADLWCHLFFLCGGLSSLCSPREHDTQTGLRGACLASDHPGIPPPRRGGSGSGGPCRVHHRQALEQVRSELASRVSARLSGSRKCRRSIRFYTRRLPRLRRRPLPEAGDRGSGIADARSEVSG